MAGPEMKAPILKDLVALAYLDIKCMQTLTVSIMSQTWNLIWICIGLDFIKEKIEKKILPMEI